jgi:hypothetical protein
MSIFKNLADLQKFVKVNATTDFQKAIQPYEQDAIDSYIIKHLSAELYAELDEYVNSTPDTPNNILDTLLPYVQRALARFMLFKASPSLDINVGTTGFTTHSPSSGGLVPASALRVEKFDRSLENLGWDAIEIMLRFLEKNKTNYPSWVASDAYTMHITGLVNTAEEFNKEHVINSSRLKFLEYRPAISRVERIQIIPVISENLFNLLVSQIKANNITEPNAKLIIPLRTAIVMFVMSQKINDTFHLNAVAFLSEARKILDQNPDNYPLYADSDIYRGGADAVYDQFVNTEDNKIFIAGAPLI